MRRAMIYHVSICAGAVSNVAMVGVMSDEINLNAAREFDIALNHHLQRNLSVPVVFVVLSVIPPGAIPCRWVMALEQSIMMNLRTRRRLASVAGSCPCQRQFT
ncbi:hypothetical protein [Cystobacter fuscus]|uniref:hypothetical protein n=1 Tax=Cystobacter fuscus TaxID=43 RepID=UPI0012FDAE1C|nr:hypothetical protein [Cystobacter fuscus]